jgi:hypothetical protein
MAITWNTVITTLNVTPGESASVALEPGSSNVVALAAGVGSVPITFSAPQFVGTSSSLNSIFYSLGSSSVTASENAGAILKPGESVVIELNGASYLAIFANNENSVNVQLGTSS